MEVWFKFLERLVSRVSLDSSSFFLESEEFESFEIGPKNVLCSAFSDLRLKYKDLAESFCKSPHLIQKLEKKQAK